MLFRSPCSSYLEMVVFMFLNYNFSASASSIVKGCFSSLKFRSLILVHVFAFVFDIKNRYAHFCNLPEFSRVESHP